MARAPLQMASASTRMRLAVRPEGKHGEEDTKAEHHQQNERCNHRSEECKRLRHRWLLLPQLRPE